MNSCIRKMMPVIFSCAFVAPALGQDADAPVEARELDQELVAQGETLWRQCRACHQIGEDAQNRVGPHLNDVIGRVAGSLEDFRYSQAMIEAGEDGLVWSKETLHPYLENPRTKVGGTSMVFAGIRQEGQRDALIEFLRSHSTEELEYQSLKDTDEEAEAD